MRNFLAWVCLLTLGTPVGAQQAGFEWEPPVASTTAPRVDSIFYTDLAISTAIILAIGSLIIFFCWKYRRGAKADRSNAPVRNPKLEAAWILIPVLISLGIYAWSARVYFDMYKAPPGAIDIYVVGKQWMWKIQHPEGQREIDELHVPVGQPVKLIMSSQDVIHSFFVPAFRIKQDVLPDRTTTTWFEATKAGQYHLYCAQYCGMNHSRMRGWVYAMEPADYQRWLSQNSGERTMATEGEKLYEQLGCSGCHGASNVVRAPSLDGLYGKPVPLKNKTFVIADDRYIHDSIVLPKSQVVFGYKPVMPSYKGQISEEQILELTAYIKSLGANTGRVDPRLPGVGNSPAQVKAQQADVKQRQQENKTSLQGGAKP